MIEIISNILMMTGIIIGAGLLLTAVIYPLVFWIRMLIDCLNRDFNDKLVWVIVLIFCNILGAILYYYCVKHKK